MSPTKQIAVDPRQDPQQDHPHGDQPVLAAGAEPRTAPLAMVMVHGRGAGARDILGLSADLGHPELAYLAPHARGASWYPYSFLAPLEANEPGLSSALARLDGLFGELAEEGLPAERVMLLGFSQGACLSLEYAARNARRLAGVAALSGGLIGPELEPGRYGGDFAGTPIFLGCSDRDPHIPLERVKESSRLLAEHGAEVTERIYPGMPHTVNQDEIDHVRRMIEGALNR